MDTKLKVLVTTAAIWFLGTILLGIWMPEASEKKDILETLFFLGVVGTAICAIWIEE